MPYDGKIRISAPNIKKTDITIDGKSYTITPYLSIYDYGAICDNYINTKDFKQTVATVIYGKILDDVSNKTVPTVEVIKDQESIFFSHFIETVIKSDEKLKEYYDEADEKTSYEQRFIIACMKFYKTIGDNLSKSLAALAKVIIKNFDFESIHRSLQQSMLSFSSILSTIDWQNYFQVLNSNLLEALRSLVIPGISEDEKKRLEASYKKWGSFGWTIIPEEDSDLFDISPTEIKEANKLALQYCNRKNMEIFFSLIRQKKLKRIDFEEAVICYKHRHYKACALILCGMIDSLLIRQQPKPMGKNEKRSTGFGAVRSILKGFDSIEEKTLSYLLLGINSVWFLKILFSGTDDFTNKPAVINRNFIAHGMNKTPVRKTDCIKLFLLLYNLSEFLDITTGLNRAL
ncbi:MAG: hypothetical protein FWD38_04320 [Oscillospiraceae bacterium]|nr:hypothetical protein [Oscillospiraceae bacterium]